MRVRELYGVFGFALLFAVAVFPAATILVPMAETAYFPVTSTASLYYANPEKNDTQVIIRLLAYKKRECAFNEVLWYYGNRDQYKTRVQVKFLEGARIRHPGLLDLGPWALHMTFEQLFEKSHADVLHQCRVFGVELPWLSRTELYK